MLIKDLPKEIQNRVKQIVEILDNAQFDLDKPLSCAFAWQDESSEGKDFWNEINDGNFEVFYKHSPTNEILAEQVYQNIIKDVREQDGTAIFELLTLLAEIPQAKTLLKGYLPE